MIDLKILGVIRLERDGEDLRRISAQPKRLALLAYLALRRSGGFVSRDELLGVFWPESAEGRARASLRQGLRFLRTHLGHGVIVNRGDAVVGIASGALTCDALRFLRALEAGDDRAAIDEYGGELLPGLIVPGAFELDRWIYSERHRLRTAAIQAALRLADEAEDRDDVREAADRARWALWLESTNEAVARRLISLYSRAGNRGAALATYRALATRLEHELDLEPSPETAELAAAVRDATGEPDPHTAVGLVPERVLVLPFGNLGVDENLLAVGQLAADVIAQGLAAVPELEVVPPMAELRSTGADADTSAGGGVNDAPPGLSAAVLELARRTRAGTVVDGDCYLDGIGGLHLQVRMTDVRRDALLPGPEPVTASVGTVADALETLRDRVVTALAPAVSRRSAHVGKASRPPSIEAYCAYLDGLELFIRGRWAEALDRFGASAQLEPEYPLPRIVAAIALWNLGRLAEAAAAAGEAAETGESLGRFERAVLDMVLAWLDGDWGAAHAACRIQADMAPDSIPHFQVAEEARRLNRPREAREVLFRLDPEVGELKGWIFYWIELTVAHHLLGDHQRELELASRSRRLHPDDPIAALLEIRALAALGREADVLRACEEAIAMPGAREPLPGALLLEAGLELRAHRSAAAAAPLLDRAAEWYRERAAPSAPEPLRRDLARTLYHAGRTVESKEIFADLAELSDGSVQPVGHHHGHLQAHLDQGYLAVIAVAEGDQEQATRWRRWLRELNRPFLYGAQWFWLAAAAAVGGDRDGATRLLRRAFADGLPREMFIHTDPHLMPLRGHPPFDALLRARS